jgi:hypothetical protein
MGDKEVRFENGSGGRGAVEVATAVEQAVAADAVAAGKLE